MSQLVYLTEPKPKKWKIEKLKSKKWIYSEVSVKVWGICGVSPDESKEGNGNLGLVGLRFH